MEITLTDGITFARLGWDEHLQVTFSGYAEQGFVPARVSAQYKGSYAVLTEGGRYTASIAGKLRHQAADAASLPVVGDWVAVTLRQGDRTATIHAVVPRRTSFSRKIAGFESSEQVLAANIDALFIVTSLNADLNPRRLERYLTMAYESGSAPVIVLTKADLCDDIAAPLDQVIEIAFGVPLHVVSTVTGEGLDELTPYLAGDRTVALLGSSGVGKSTLVNRLAGEDLLKVQDVREDDDKGRHTTTHREMVMLPNGGIVIDTPGMRELQLWHADEGLGRSFGDIDELGADCRFRDCGHDTEPGCAVLAAVETGALAAARLASFRKLQRELVHLQMKTDRRLATERTRQWKVRHKAMRKSGSPKV